MKNAKTIGGIKDFSTQESTYEKWVLNRSAQAEYVSELLQQAGLKMYQITPENICGREKLKKQLKILNPF